MQLLLLPSSKFSLGPNTAMKLLSLFFFLATIVATSHASAALHHPFSCLSWRLTVETNNIRNWDLVPQQCATYVARYMLGHQYSEDCNAVTAIAAEYASGLRLARDGRDIWVFDTAETVLSNIAYYSRPENDFGAKTYNDTSYNEWVLEAISPPVPAVLGLYKKLLTMGFKIAFITGKSESQREATATNLKRAGYHTWEKLILKKTSEKGLTALVYKSLKRKELEEQGYRIRGNMGDQWSDISGTNVGNRTFKLPNPMYYLK